MWIKAEATQAALWLQGMIMRLERTLATYHDYRLYVDGNASW